MWITVVIHSVLCAVNPPHSLEYLLIYIYIYICVCVCVCMCERGFVHIKRMEKIK
jgi:hypothetical protein